ncbi:MAG: hypothetical protein KDB61_05385, partial [Planctomycetes bacterium]|nr:hypothetical protein [Planctomycetota bacterium]
VTIALEQPAADDARPPLLPGMMVRLFIITERHPEALVVQKRALRREGDRRHIFVVREGVAQRVNVEEGLLGELDVEIFPPDGSDLVVGDQVVVVGGRDLEDGARVQATDDLGMPLDATPAKDMSTASESTEAGQN